MSSPRSHPAASRVPGGCRPLRDLLVLLSAAIGANAMLTLPAFASTTRWETLQMPVELAADAANWEQFPAVVAILPMGLHADLLGGHTRTAWVGRVGSARLIAGSTQTGEVRLGVARGGALRAAGVQLWGDVQPGGETEREESGGTFLLRDKQRSVGAGVALGLRVSGVSAAAIDLALEAGVHRRSEEFGWQSPEEYFKAEPRSAASYRLALGADCEVASGIGRLVLQTDRLDDRASVVERRGDFLPQVPLVGFYFREHAVLAGRRSVERPHGVLHVSVSFRDWEKADRRDRVTTRWFEQSHTEVRASIGVESRVYRSCVLRAGVAQALTRGRRAQDPDSRLRIPRYVSRVEEFSTGRTQVGAEFALGGVILDVNLETEQLLHRGLAGASVRWSQ